MSVQLFRPIRGRRIFEEILDQLEQAILEGRISAGDRLPSERQLAEQFSASRTSVREAVRVLEALGVARVKAGAENGAMLVEESDDALRLPLRFQLALRHISVASVIEFRLALEPWAARVASKRATGASLERITAIVAAMEEGVGQEQFHQLDASLHVEIARAAENDLMVLVLDGARTAIEQIMLDALTRVPDWPATRGRLLEEHSAIVAAIAGGNGAEAASLMERHISSFYDEVGLSSA